eukprot:TRINITY_DN37831_c0_g1_i3.p2 TRINITY_DN37831_c0_g1~~TRINITY_DN37831_c0_g1_i3.p2  ORF type:complete len:115 (+),score=16.27 TRINITY_DN37831_c0_g1_i3:3-347(+)
MLNMFGLSQSVCQPTHKRGRIIDCVLFRPQDNVVQSTSLTQELSSDHLCVVCDLHVEASPAPVIYKEASNLRALDREVFTQDLRMTVSPTLSLHRTAGVHSTCCVGQACSRHPL